MSTSFKSNAVAAIGGALFAVGLVVSGMTRTEKVIGFLDLAGSWDASLAFVMVGAIGVYGVLSRVITRRKAPLFDASFHLPTRRDLDHRLLGGAALFGIGWGVAGYCPGPGLVSATTGGLPALVFVGGMTVGVLLEHQVARIRARQSMTSSPPEGSPGGRVGA
jgi:hypothetical protein